MKYAVEIDSVVMIYMPSFIKIGSDIQRLIGGIHRRTHSQTHILTNTHTAWKSHKPTWKSRLRVQQGTNILLF
jgi:hypothetical protein